MISASIADPSAASIKAAHMLFTGVDTPLMNIPEHQPFNTLRLRWNGGHFADDILKCIFLNENVWISIEISLKFVPKGAIDNIPALV